jgi:hypothetical protein
MLIGSLRFVGVVAACVASAVGLSAATAQVSSTQQLDPIEFAEGTFRLPSSDWHVPAADQGRFAGSVIQAVQ